ncbi:MAG TPA: ABC transporter substrate-binding protein [Syntrophorhabdaceae bacterium]|nr:ABC transporter substrate-binding protein [Syntrophorhabdaceae bacterium]
MKKSMLVILVLATAILFSLSYDSCYGQTKKTPIKIGVIADKTGGLAAYGYSHEKVIKAAVERINKAGGITGRQVEVYVEDTESKPSVGALKFRKLIETYGVDFVFDSNSSGIAVACAPIAKELKVPYFPSASVSEISGEKGNRYVFQSCTSVRAEAKGAAKFAIKHIGKKWVTVVVNYAWGWSNEQDFTKYITEDGGKVLASIRVPLGASDWLPYLKGKIPKEADAVFFANFGSDFLSFIRDLHAVRPDIKKLGAVYALSAQDIKKLGAAAEGLYCITPYPTMLEGLNTKNNKVFRDLIGVDTEGKELGTGTRLVLAYNWAMWQAVNALKAGIEKSGWQKKEDTPKLIKALEGMEFKESVDFPQGDMRIRAEDHMTIAGLYVEQVVKGTLKVVGKIPAADTVYPPQVDFTKESF